MSAVASVVLSTATKTKFANKKVVFGTCTLSSSYTAGGDTLSAAQAGLSNIEQLIIQNPNSGGYTLGFNGISSNAAKIQGYLCTAGTTAEVSGSLTGVAVRFMAVGT
jgi:hypothetical protein